MNARLQTWFPFNIQVCLNGREWLARQLARRASPFHRADNCFTWLGKLYWQPLRKGVADLHRRAEISHRSNERSRTPAPSASSDARSWVIPQGAAIGRGHR
jgi:hypothetical protein